MPRRTPTRRLGVCVISSPALALEELARPLAQKYFRSRTLRFDELRAGEPDRAGALQQNASAAEAVVPRADAYILDAHAPRPINESRIADLFAAHSAARVLIVAEKFSEAEALGFLRIGVRGLLTYKESRAQLPAAVRAVTGGGYWVPRAWLGKFVDSVVGTKGKAAPPAGRVAGARARMSRREQQVLDALLENLANKEIASRLNISERTVKFHVSNLLAKFGVRRRADLILLTFQSGSMPQATH